MTPDLSRRSNLTELMDSDETDFATFRDCLVDLAKVNTLTLAYRPTLQFFDRLAKTRRLPKDRAAIILDVGSGFGDMLRVIDRWAKRRGIKVDLTGVDRNPWSARAAMEAPNRGRAIRFVTADVFDFRPPRGVDIVISSLRTTWIRARSPRAFGGLAWRSRHHLGRGAARVSLPLCVSRVKA